jgi:nucleoside-diphosphate-sugar epimerase
MGIDIRDRAHQQNWIKMDMREPVLDAKYDLVIHLASDVGGINYIRNDKLSMIENNIDIDLKIIKFCATNKIRLVYFSSSCVYDDNLYGKEKKFAEEFIRHEAGEIDDDGNEVS